MEIMRKLIYMFICAMLLLPIGVMAQNDDENQSKFDELTEGTEMVEGFFDLYQKDGKLYMAISKEDLNKDFLMNFEISQGNRFFGVIRWYHA